MSTDNAIADSRVAEATDLRKLTGLGSADTRRNMPKALALECLYGLGGLKALQSVAKRCDAKGLGRAPWIRFRKSNAHKFLILCYHRVGMGGVPLYSELAPAVFEAQMKYLRRNHRIVTLAQLCRDLDDPQAAPAVAVTFDDGYRDLYRYALPILTKYEIPATVFLIADAVETGRLPWYDRIFLALQVMPGNELSIDLDESRRFQLSSPPERFRAALEIVVRLRRLPDSRRKACSAQIESMAQIAAPETEGHMLNWEEVHAMRRAGISFGSHTVTHPVVSKLSRQQMVSELAESKQLLESKLDGPVNDFAFPFGSADDCGLEAPEILPQYGYRSAVTTIPGVNRAGANPFTLRRVQVAQENAAQFALLVNRALLFTGSDQVADESSLHSEKLAMKCASYRCEGNPNA